jgi:hypothetical protein
MATNALNSAFEQLSYGSPSGCIATGEHREVISNVGATYSLSPSQSGALCLFDRAAGVVYTLPAPVVGMTFDFQTVTTITSGAAKVITAAATDFLIGVVDVVIAGSATSLAASANGTTIRAISSNGTTTGGVIGDCYTVTAISSTQWAITGFVSGSGSIATPFATS